MKSASEVKNAVECIKYYSNIIEDRCHKQFVEDFNLNDMNAQAGSLRFDSLGAMAAACSWIDNYCINIEKNLEVAIKQGKLLLGPDREE